MLERENASYIYSMNNGAIRVKPLKKHHSFVIINNSSFDNMNANYGGAISLFEVGKIRVMNTNFTRKPTSGSNFTNFTLKNFVPYSLPLLGNFINITLLTTMVDSLVRYSG